jgi:beta-xylosidase
VDTKTGEDWFLHFQDKEAYGRVVHLQPMKWMNDWPVIGLDKDGNGKGEPVLKYKKPNLGRSWPIATVQDNDEFNNPSLGLQWQWQANNRGNWAFATPSGSLRIFSVYQPDSVRSIWNLPSILGQKLPAEEFIATVKISAKLKFVNERVGFTLFGTDYALLAVQRKADGIYISYSVCMDADKGKEEKEIVTKKISSSDVYFQIRVDKGAIADFSFSEDGKTFERMGAAFKAKPGKWVGAKLGLFSTRINITNDAGYADIDWIRFTPAGNER